MSKKTQENPTVREARISNCGTYRYTLSRYFGENKASTKANAPFMLFVMLNPSTADARADDPTIINCKRIAKHRGYDKFMVVNLYAYRSTDPSVLKNPPPTLDVIGPDNDRHIRSLARRASELIVAWGRHGDKYRVAEVRRILRATRKPLLCLGHNKDRSPRHPLYLRADTPLVPWTTSNHPQEHQQ